MMRTLTTYHRAGATLNLVSMLSTWHSDAKIFEHHIFLALSGIAHRSELPCQNIMWDTRMCLMIDS